MKLLILMRCILTVPGFLIALNCRSQLSAADSSLYYTAVNNAIGFYHHALFPEAKLYDGTEYIVYDYQIHRGSPYFQSTKFSPGFIVYNNMLYENIPMMYDQVKDNVVINAPVKGFSIGLNSEKITRFGILGHNFIRIIKDSSANGLIKTGFYELLYKGKLSLLEKQNKNIQDDYTNTLEKYISESTSFYIEKDAKYFSVNSKKSLLMVLGNRKKEIKQYIRKNRLGIGKDKSADLVKIVAYYDEITN